MTWVLPDNLLNCALLERRAEPGHRGMFFAHDTTVVGDNRLLLHGLGGMALRG